MLKFLEPRSQCVATSACPLITVLFECAAPMIKNAWAPRNFPTEVATIESLMLESIAKALRVSWHLRPQPTPESGVCQFKQPSGEIRRVAPCETVENASF